MTSTFKTMPKEEKPREKAIKYGIEMLSNAELLAILLRTGTKEKNVQELALTILQEMDKLKGLKNSRLSKLASIKGVGKVKAITILAAIELGKRLNINENEEKIKLNNTTEVYQKYKDKLENETQEKFIAIFLNNQNIVLGTKLMFIGISNKSLIEPKEIFKEAMLYNAQRLIILHNHPSGNPKPSKEDYFLTKQIQNAGFLLNIILIDHLIIGKDDYFSFYDYLKGDKKNES